MIQQIKIALQIDAFIQPTLAIVLILTGIYQAAENTRFPMYTTAIGIWFIRTLGVYFLGVYLEWGIVGVWIAIGLDNLFRTILLGFYFQNNKWLNNRIELSHTKEARPLSKGLQNVDKLEEFRVCLQFFSIKID